VKADRPTVTTKGRALDHIGFDVKNLEAFLNNLQANGIKLDRPYTKTPLVALAFIYDPWGTYIELNERPSYQ
jgi:predicted enzyme related to lactoylglutathione lyase